MARRDDWLMRNAGLLLAGGTIAFLAYTYWPGEAQVAAKLSVRSVNQNGQEITGMWTVLTRRDGTREERFTPTTFENVPTGEAHTLQTDSFGDRTFQMWSDGQTTKTRPVTLSRDTSISSVFTVATPPPPPPPPGGMGMTVFTYFGYGGLGSYPWNEIVAAKKAFPRVNIIVVVNPCSGSCYGSQATKNQIRDLKSAGLTVVGYVFTGDCCGGTHRSAAALRTNIQQAYNDGVQGIFYDGSGGRDLTTEQLQDYRDAVAYARSLGLDTNIGNPGRCYLPLSGIFDIVCTYEGSGRPSVSTVSGCSIPRAKKSVIPHNVGGSFDRALISNILDNCSYYYEITQFDAWHVTGAFPPWFRDIAALIDSKIAATGARLTERVPIIA